MNPRSCGSCALCCKLLHIEEIEKPAGVWCSQVRFGHGCGIYESRPNACRAFRCNWLNHAGLDDSWRPDRAGFVLWTPSPKLLLVVVEPTKSDAWRRKPYYAQLKDWSKTALTGQGMVLVKVRQDATVLLPQSDIHIGPIAAADTVTVGAEQSGRGWVDVTREDASVTRHGA